MTRIKVDFNNLVRQGQVRASLRHADGDVRVGDTVEAFDDSDDLVVEATVMEVDKNRVYLEPHWEPAGSGTHSRVKIAGFCLQTFNSTYSALRPVKYSPQVPTRVSEGVLVTS